MSRMKILPLLFVILVLVSSTAVAQDDLSSIRNFLRVNKEFCTGGQPKPEHPQQLKGKGVEATIDVRQPSEHRAAGEEAKTKGVGLRYFTIPLAFADARDGQGDEFLKITDDPDNRPAFIHCAGAIRVGAFWMIRRVLRDGWKIEDAEAEAEKIGLRESPQLNEFAHKYIETHRKSATALPSDPLSFGVFTMRFDPAGTFTMGGEDWPKLSGSWKSEDANFALSVGGVANAPGGCDGPGKYRASVDGKHVLIALVADECKIRQMMMDGSTWLLAGEAVAKPVRNFVRTAHARPPSRSTAATGAWPSFRGPSASGIAEGQNLPDKWDAKTGENILWRTPVPGLAHSSPIVWGNRIYVTTAISGDPKATFKPGLYGDGDASKDRSVHKWMIYALDKHTGKIVWQRVAFEGVPREKRHMKATYANATPATDGRIVVAWFGSQGVYAYDVNGRLLWKVDVGRMDLGAYDVPTVEWGPASS